MCRETGKPMDGAAEHVNAAIRQDGADDLSDAVFALQEKNTYKILAILNQEHLEDAFGDKSTASEPDTTPEFSQAFMDGMRSMVAESYGYEAAEKLMTQEYNQENKREVHHRPKNVSATEKIMSQATANQSAEKVPLNAERSVGKKNHRGIFLLTWTRRAAAVLLLVMGLTFGAYQISVQAIKLPMVNTKPQTMEDYSKVGSLEDIISHLDITSYPKELKHVYVPEVVADGYQETERNQIKKFIEIYYQNENGQQYQYQQMTVDINSFIDTEHGEGKNVTVGEYVGFFAKKKDKVNLWWFDYQYAYQIEGDLAEDEMIAIAESLYELKE